MKNAHHNIPEPNVTSSYCSFLSKQQSETQRFFVNCINEKEKQQTLIFKKLEAVNV